MPAGDRSNADSEPFGECFVTQAQSRLKGACGAACPGVHWVHLRQLPRLCCILALVPHCCCIGFAWVSAAIHGRIMGMENNRFTHRQGIPLPVRTDVLDDLREAGPEVVETVSDLVQATFER